MKYSVLVILTFLCLLVGTIPEAATLIHYSDWASFNAAHPGLIVENFEKGIVNNRDFLEPLNNTSNNESFSPDDILPGISFSTSDNVGLYLRNDIFPSKTLTTSGDYPSGTGLVIEFSGSGVDTVGFDFYVFLSGLESASTHISVYFFGGDISIMTMTSSDTGPAFFGVSSDSNKIKKIIILGEVPGYFEWEGIDNVAFPTTAPDYNAGGFYLIPHRDGKGKAAVIYLD